MPERLKARL